MTEVNRRKFLQSAAAGALMAGLPLDVLRGRGADVATASIARSSHQGEWLQFRGDRTLTGRSTLKGTIKEPAIKWKHFCGGREVLCEIDFLPQPDKPGAVLLPTADTGTDPRDTVDARKQLLATYDPQAGVGPGLQVGKFLADAHGLQIVECESCFGKYASFQPPGTGEFCQMLARDKDEWKRVWRTDPIPQLFMPNVITGDFDHDGKMEIAFTPWYELWVLDAATGKLKSKCRFSPAGAESGRAYGYLGAFDVDGDGMQEFILLPDFENQMAVIGWRDGQLKLLWNRLIERGIGNKKTLFRPGAQPVQDVDGDGKLEIVVSLYNATGDDRWHVLVLDALTGKEKLNLADQYLTGLRDIDGDGTPEFFLTKPQGRLVPEPSALSIISFRQGSVVHRWELAAGAYQTRMISEYAGPVQNGTTTSGLTVLAEPAQAGGRPVFFTRQVLNASTGAAKLIAWQSDDKGAIGEIGNFTGDHLEVLVTRPHETDVGALLMRAEIHQGRTAKIDTAGATLRPVFSAETGIPITTAVVARLKPALPPEVIVESSEEMLECFRPGRADSHSEPVWHARGRSIHSAAQSAGSVVLADVMGNGELAAIAATLGAKNCARLEALDADGKELWTHDFDRFSGETPVRNLGGLVFWFAGHFTDPNRCDVVVTLARAQLHSEETFLLDGRTGKEIWHRTQGSHFGVGPTRVRAFGGGWMSIFDYDGDGLDDILTFYPDGVLAVQGHSAKTLLDLSTNGRVGKGIFEGEWTFMATPVVADFIGNGNLQMLYGASTYRLALLDLQGNIIWQNVQDVPPASLGGIDDNVPEHFGRNVGNHSTPASLQGIGDIDGDGKLEVLSPGHRREPASQKQDFHCYDAATGKLKWKLPLPGSCFGPNQGAYADSPTATAVADIDGDGRDETVFGIGKSLYAVGAAKNGMSGEVRWSLAFPDSIGPPSIADTRGDGKPEIVVVCADGYVYGVGPDAKARHSKRKSA